MGDPAAKRATYADIEAAPRHVVAELVAGVLHTHPRPAPAHANAAAALTAELRGPFGHGKGGPGGWRLLIEPELHLGEDVVVPDLAGWRVQRMPRIPRAAFIALPPDWICEILSPSTAAYDREEKMPVYARARVSWAWLVDPLARTLEVHRLSGGAWTVEAVHREGARVRAQPFDAAELDLALLWAELEEG